METFWLVRKRAVDVFTVIYHRSNDSSILHPSSLSDFLFSVALSLCVCFASPPAGWDLDHYRVREDDGGAERDLCHPGELCVFHLSSSHGKSLIVSAPTPHFPYLETHILVLFQSDPKINNSGERFQLTLDHKESTHVFFPNTISPWTQKPPHHHFSCVPCSKGCASVWTCSEKPGDTYWRCMEPTLNSLTWDP